VKLVANAQGLSSGLSKGRSLVDSFSNSFGGTLAAATSPAALLGDALTRAQEAAAEIARTFKALDEIADTSKKIGLAADELQELRFAAKMSDVEIGHLDDALGKMRTTIGEAVLEGGEGAKALSKLGLSAADLKKLSLKEAFLEIADALNDQGNAYTRSALAKDIFGKGAKEILPVLELGRAGIRAYADELQRMGGVIDDAGLERLNRLDDTLKRVEVQYDQIRKKQTLFMIEMGDAALQQSGAPPDMGVMDAWSLAVDAAQLGMRELHRYAVDLRAISKQDWGHFLQTDLLAPGAGGGDFGPTDEEMARQEKQRKQQEALDTAVNKLHAGFSKQLATMGMGANEAKVYELQLQGLAGAELDLAYAAAKEIDALKDIKKAQDPVLENMAEWVRYGQRIYQETRTPLEKFEQDLADLEVLAEMGLDPETVQRRLDQLRQGLAAATAQSRAGLPEAMMRGSARAVAVIQQSRAGGGANEVGSKVDKGFERNGAKIEHGNRELRDINRKMDKLPDITVAED